MFNTLYKKDSNPLELIVEVELNELYFTEAGYGIKFIDKDEVIIVQASPLVLGEYMYNLTKKQLRLFWTIVKNTEYPTY